MLADKNLDEAGFNALADEMLASIEAALENCAIHLDYEVKPGGVLEIEFEDGSKIIINRHTAAREIWIAAKSGGFHFRPDAGRWLGTRDGAELLAALSDFISRQSGQAVTLAL